MHKQLLIRQKIETKSQKYLLRKNALQYVVKF
jgi:hypothetical protein